MTDPQPPSNEPRGELFATWLAHLRQIAEEEESQVSTEILEMGRNAEVAESTYLETYSEIHRNLENVFKTIFKLFVALVRVLVKAFWIFFCLTLITYLFVFGWYIILCQGIQKVIYITHLWPPWCINYEISNIPFKGLAPEVINIYLGAVIVQTFIFIGAVQKLVIKEETLADKLIGIGKQAVESLVDFISVRTTRR